MEIDLSELRGEPCRFAIDLEVTSDELDDPVVSGPVSVRMEGSVRRLAAGFAVAGQFRATGSVRCSRCTAPIPWASDEAFSFELRSPDQAPLEEEVELAADELEVVFSDSTVLSVDELAVQQVLLALPMKPLCREHCAGICPGCGADLNAGESCRCGAAAVDPRWAPLAALKNDPDRS